MNNTIVKSVATYLLPLTIITSILLFLPFTPNYYTSAKQLFLLISVAILFLSWGTNLITQKSLSLTRSTLSLPLFLFALALITNLFINKEGWLDALTGRGSLYLGGILLAYFSMFLSGSNRAVKMFIYSFVISSSVLALHSLLQLTVLYRIDTLPAFMNSRAFTLTGSPLTSLILLVIGAITTFYLAAKNLKGNFQYLFFVLATLQTIAAVAYISLMLPGGELSLNLLPYQASWAVTLDALKSSKSFLFGIGLANFSSLFTSVKPLSLNSTMFWNSLPTSASSELLQLLSTTGIVGLGTFLLLPIMVFVHKAKHNSLLFLIFLCSLVALVLTPASIPLIALFFVSLGLLEASSSREIELSPLATITTSVLFILLASVISFYSVRAYLAEAHMFRAQKALAAQDGKTVYEQHQAAISLMPKLANYYLSFSQVNLSLASALSQKKDLTSTEREQVTTLVQQSISEAKYAASLHPHDVKVWQNLGNIYRNLINVAEGADQFAVSAYAQAVTLDPANPALRVDFGGLLYQLASTTKDQNTKGALLSRSIQEFQTAVQLKNDYANAYYNLSKALESAGNVQASYAAMQKAVASLDPNSPDLVKATSDLETLKGKLPKPSPSASPSTENSSTNQTEITQPSPLPSPISGGPIDLPTESPLPTTSPTP